MSAAGAHGAGGGGAGDCIFCKIVAGAIPSPRLFENERFIVIKDIRPAAPTHFLVIPKQHVVSLDHAFADLEAPGAREAESSAALANQHALMGEMLGVGTQVARQIGLLPDGFRAIINTGVNGGQTVFHLHLHIIGGKALGEEL